MVSLLFRNHLATILATDPDPDNGDPFTLEVAKQEPCLFTVGLDTSGSQSSDNFESFSEKGKCLISRPVVFAHELCEGQRVIIENIHEEVVGIYQITSIIPAPSSFIILLGKDSGEF